MNTYFLSAFLIVVVLVTHRIIRGGINDCRNGEQVEDQRIKDLYEQDETMLFV